MASLQLFDHDDGVPILMLTVDVMLCAHCFFFLKLSFIVLTMLMVGVMHFVDILEVVTIFDLLLF